MGANGGEEIQVSEAYASSIIGTHERSSNASLLLVLGSSFQRHPFFEGLNWELLDEAEPPFVPQLDDEYDLGYYEARQQEEAYVVDDETVLKVKHTTPRSSSELIMNHHSSQAPTCTPVLCDCV